MGRACKTAPGRGHTGPTQYLVKGGSVQHILLASPSDGQDALTQIVEEGRSLPQ